MTRQIDLPQGRVISTRLVLNPDETLVFDTVGRIVKGRAEKLAERFRFRITNTKGQLLFLTPSEYSAKEQARNNFPIC